MDKKKMHSQVSTITQTDDYLQFIEKINNKNIKLVEEIKKEEVKEVDAKQARSDSLEEPTSQSASVENSPEKKQPPAPDKTSEVTATKPKDQSNI
jgi:Asp-tRNA(Asn)/Glu-tRNA(Gln) amidotransferase C subunit